MLVTRRGRVGVRLNVSNTSVDLLNWIAKTTKLGGIFKHRNADELHKASFSWRCHADGAESIIKQIKEYLVIKVEQADLALETHRRLRIPRFKVDLTWQAEFRLLMKALNRRGPKPIEAEAVA